MSTFWQYWLIAWAWSVVGFGAILSGGAFEATSAPVRFVFDLLNGTGGLPFDENLRFSLAVLGAVSIGWGITAFGIIRAAIAFGERSAPLWSALTTGTATWFVIDSAFSVATGFELNVLPNCLLLGGLLIPVFANRLLTQPQATTK
jgi:hypothetical protein